MIYSVIYLKQYELTNILHWVIIQYSFILLLKLFQLWSLGALSVGSCTLLICRHQCHFCYLLLFSTSLLSGTTRRCKLILWISCPRPTISHFPKVSWLLSLESDFRNQNLVFGVSLLLDPLSWQSREICMYILTNKYTHSSKYFSICETTPIYANLNMTSY